MEESFIGILKKAVAEAVANKILATINLLAISAISGFLFYFNSGKWGLFISHLIIIIILLAILGIFSIKFKTKIEQFFKFLILKENFSKWLFWFFVFLFLIINLSVITLLTLNIGSSESISDKEILKNLWPLFKIHFPIYFSIWTLNLFCIAMIWLENTKNEQLAKKLNEHEQRNEDGFKTISMGQEYSFTEAGEVTLVRTEKDIVTDSSPLAQISKLEPEWNNGEDKGELIKVILELFDGKGGSKEIQIKKYVRAIKKEKSYVCIYPAEALDVKAIFSLKCIWKFSDPKFKSRPMLFFRARKNHLALENPACKVELKVILPKKNINSDSNFSIFNCSENEFNAQTDKFIRNRNNQESYRDTIKDTFDDKEGSEDLVATENFCYTPQTEYHEEKPANMPLDLHGEDSHIFGILWTWKKTI